MKPNTRAERATQSRTRAERAMRARPAPTTSRETAIVLAATAQVLAYPEQPLLDNLDVIREALAGTDHAGNFTAVLSHLGSRSLTETQSFHVQEFDLSRRHSMHLSYWTHGDTRQRGEVLAAFKQIYRDSGLLVDLQGELPDHLPLVCEFAAISEGMRGLELLAAWQPSLEMLRLALIDDKLPHAGVLDSLCRLLPGRRPATRDEVRQMMAQAQPVEQVGLETYSIGRRN